KQVDGLRQENRALRLRQVRADQPRAVAPPISSAPSIPPRPVTAQPVPVQADSGPYAAVVKAPAYPAAPRGTWTGPYAGVNLGLALGQSRTSRASQFLGDPSTIGDRFDLAPFGVVGGAQVGFNWQAAPNWVAGLETDLQGSGAADTACMYV